MAKTLSDYVAYYKPKYEFVLKATFDLTNWVDTLKNVFELIDNKYELDSKSEIKRNGFRPDIDFSGKDVVESWEITFTVNYPVTDREIHQMFVDYGYMRPESFIVRTANSAEIRDSNKRAEKPEEKEALLTSEIKPLEDVKQEELTGQKYTDDMLKALDSKEFKDKSPVKEYKVKGQK